MNRKRNLILIVSVLVLIFLIVIMLLKNDNLDSVRLYINNDINKNIYNIDYMGNDNYSLEYQKLIEKKINSLERKNKYTFNDPLLILNPYGTYINGLYIYFETGSARLLEYTISVEDESIPDYTNILVGDLTKIHSGQIIGLIQGVKNTVTFRLFDENMEQVAIRKIIVNMPLYNENLILKIKLKENKNLDGGLIHLPYQDDDSNLYFYDINGILRMELYGKDNEDSQVFKYNNDGDLLYLNGSKYIHINKNGKIINYYDEIDNLSNFRNIDKIKHECVVKSNSLSCIKYSFSNILFGTFNGFLSSDNNLNNNKIIISKDKKYKYNPSTNMLLGYNNLSSVDFIYYDNIYFDLYNYNKDEITIPSKVDSVKIKKITGFNISDVKIIRIESGVEEIMDYCFVGAKKLEKIYVPKSVVKIGKNIFGDRNVEIIYY